MSIIGPEAVKLAAKTVMSGIQPTGKFHVGNILGAVQTWADFSRQAPSDTSLIFMIADLHSLTVPRRSEELRQARKEALASIIAAGIDPNRCNVYFQSDVPAHSQLHWLLSSVSSMGYLSRMVQWKSKAHLDTSVSVNNAGQISDVNLALFSYPVLQAADILVNDAHYVPVGEDQSQHLELTRHIAQSVNYRYPEAKLTVPKTVLTPFKKVLSLRDVTKKMSKSDSDQNACIYVTESPDSIRDKLRRAVTDSIQGPIDTYDPENRPAVSNLVLMAAGLESVSPQEFLNKHSPRNHRQLKEIVSETVIRCIQPMTKKYHQLIDDAGYLESVAKAGSERAQERTNKVFARVKSSMGLGP